MSRTQKNPFEGAVSSTRGVSFLPDKARDEREKKQKQDISRQHKAAVAAEREARLQRQIERSYREYKPAQLRYVA